MNASRQLLVGLFLAGGILLFAVGLFWIGDRRLMFADHIVLNTGFYNLSGLQNGAKVRVSGVDAGEVLQITVPPDPEAKFRVEFRVLEKFRPILRTDSVATIQTEGLVGNMILQVGAGSSEGTPVSSGDTIQSREPVELSDMVQQASDTVETIHEAVLDVKKQLDYSLTQVTDLATETGEVIVEVSRHLERFVTTGNRVTDDVQAIVERVRQGEGTVGRLMNDPELYENLKGTIDEVEQAAANIRESTEKANTLLAEFKSSGAIEDVSGAIENVREITDQAKQAFAELRPKGEPGEAGTMADLQATITNAREATADLAENMEALKRNFLLRGFFKGRGFYDMAELSLDEYLSGEFAPKRDRRRTWLHLSEVFVPGSEPELSEEGRKKLDEIMAGYLVYAPTTPLMVEGYSAPGEGTEEFMHSRMRAAVVRRHLLDKYDLKPNYVGLMPMGARESDGPGEGYWEGVAVIYFPEKEKDK